MGKRPGLKYAAIQRLDTLMADGHKRSEAKAEASARGEPLFGFTDGKIHAFETRTNYQRIIMRFLDWCRDEHDLHDLEQVDARADDLAVQYLSERMIKGYSAWTLQTERSALRTFFGNRELAEDVALPKRERSQIKRSRLPAQRDRHFQPEHWQPFIAFCLACGLRREELRDLYVRDIYHRQRDGQLVVHVRRGKGGKEREVEVFPGREQDILGIIAGRDGDEKVFARLPSADIHAYRRQFAQELYVYYSGRPLPVQEGRLRPEEIDRQAAEKVTKALGHNRIDIIFKYYVR